MYRLDHLAVLGLRTSVSSISNQTLPAWTRLRVISCSLSGSVLRFIIGGDVHEEKSDSFARLSQTASAGVGSFLFLFSCSSRSSSAVSSKHRSSVSGMVGVTLCVGTVICPTSPSPTRLHDFRRLPRLVWEASSSLHILFKDIFVCSLVQAQIVSVRDGRSNTLCGHGDVHNFVNVLWSLVGEPLSLHVHRDTCHAVNVLNPQHFSSSPVCVESEGTAWLQTFVSPSTDSCPNDSGHEPHSCVQLQTWT